jgi:hypothetical protein
MLRSTTALRIALIVAVVAAIAMIAGGLPWGPG